ncbi:hypothetical protein CEUSTIGMA_g1447.t1 [Chlamydomonas eustigma]|uniref:Uncharacterized protein n=1 Tax=Chlamydomonas eustigma TaxID=1157962 RepID=A0A250WT48_9CHLO|nr:hypothetical protein CEUSTIGMA_g1447.t1 [Chlamydomonas eustigma]|eukprot:GAX73997.1 hypothetical protein CEUSTIGMA_g1447.t1 [Chlamydomonas eustigma]
MFKNISILCITSFRTRNIWPIATNKVLDGTSYCVEALQDEGPIPVDPQLQDLFTRLSRARKQEQKLKQSSATPSLLPALGQPRQPRVTAAASSRQPSILHLESLPQLLATIAWAFGQVKFYHNIWGKMARLLIDHPDILRRMDPDDLKRLAVGFARVKVYDKRLFKQIAQNAMRCLQRLSPHQMTQIVWSFSEVRHMGEDLLLEAINDKAVTSLQNLEKTDMICLARSLAELHALKVKLFVKMLPYWRPEVLSSLKLPSLLDILTTVAILGNYIARHQTIKSDSDQASVAKLLLVSAPLVMNHVETTLKELEIKLKQERVDLKGVEADPKERVDLKGIEADPKERVDLKGVEADPEERGDLKGIEADPEERGDLKGVEADPKERVDLKGVEADPEERVDLKGIEADPKERVDLKGVEADPKDAEASSSEIALKPEWPVWERASQAFLLSSLIKPSIGKEVVSKIKLLEPYKVRGVIHATAAGNESKTSS